MRVLNADLTTSQQAASAIPYIRLELISRDQVTVLTYTTADATNRIISVKAAEGFEGASIRQTQGPDGRPIAIAAEIVLQNNDNEFTSKDLRGYKINIGWGFNTASGDRYSEGEPFWVVSQSEESREGVNVTILQCFSAWQYVNYLKALGPSTGTPYTSTGVIIRHMLMDVLTSNPDSVQIEDTPVFVDETVDAQTNAADDVTLLPATPAVDDSVYIGSNAVFDRISIEITTAAVKGPATYTLSYQFSEGGSVWSTLASVRDNTVEFTVAGLKTITFNLPTGWATATVNLDSHFWIRLRITAANGSALTTQPKIGRIGISRHWGLQVDTTDSIEDTFKPLYSTPYNRSTRQVLRDLIGKTQSKLIMKKEEWVVDKFDKSPASADYVYSLAGDHTFFLSEREQGLVIPNRIVAVDLPPPNDTLSGTANDSASQTAVGIIVEIYPEEGLTSGDAANVASRVLERYKQKAYQGVFEAPMNCGQEPWDWIDLTDTRTAITYSGRVGRIVRDYDPARGRYRIIITLGIARRVPLSKFGEAPIIQKVNKVLTEGMRELQDWTDSVFTTMQRDLIERQNKERTRQEQRISDFIRAIATQQITTFRAITPIPPAAREDPLAMRREDAVKALEGLFEMFPEAQDVRKAEAVKSLEKLFEMFPEARPDSTTEQLPVTGITIPDFPFPEEMPGDPFRFPPRPFIRLQHLDVVDPSIFDLQGLGDNLYDTTELERLVHPKETFMKDIHLKGSKVTVEFTYGESITDGDVVYVDTANTIKKGTFAKRTQRVGVADQTLASGLGRVVVLGIKTVVADEAFAVGVQLVASDGTAGRVKSLATLAVKTEAEGEAAVVVGDDIHTHTGPSHNHSTPITGSTTAGNTSNVGGSGHTHTQNASNGPNAGGKVNVADDDHTHSNPNTLVHAQASVAAASQLHTHVENTAASYTQNAITNGPSAPISSLSTASHTHAQNPTGIESQAPKLVADDSHTHTSGATNAPGAGLIAMPNGNHRHASGGITGNAGTGVTGVPSSTSSVSPSPHTHDVVNAQGIILGVARQASSAAGDKVQMLVALS